MKTSTIIWIIVIIIVILGGWYLIFGTQGSSALPVENNQSINQITNQPATQTTQTISTTTPTASSKTQSFKVNGNDASADLTNITVPKGTPVAITFGADSVGTYHGGLDFRSSVINTGPISPGNTKTISFTANQSFSFIPYWPSTNIAKPYTININVQ